MDRPRRPARPAGDQRSSSFFTDLSAFDASEDAKLYVAASPPKEFFGRPPLPLSRRRRDPGYWRR